MRKRDSHNENRNQISLKTEAIHGSVDDDDDDDDHEASLKQSKPHIHII